MKLVCGDFADRLYYNIAVRAAKTQGKTPDRYI
jgi:hypothetical protein